MLPINNCRKQYRYLVPRVTEMATSVKICSKLALGGGGGDSIKKFYMERLHPEVQIPYLLIYLFCQHGTPFIYLEQNCTPFLYLEDQPKQFNRITYNVFPGLQSLCFRCSKGATFYVFCIVISAKIWHPLIYFALATISSTLQLIL